MLCLGTRQEEAAIEAERGLSYTPGLVEVVAEEELGEEVYE